MDSPLTDTEQELLTRVCSRLVSGRHLRSAPLIRQSLARGLETDDNGINVVSIYESREAGVNSLMPYKCCPAYSSSFGSDQSAVYKGIFAKPITERLDAIAAGFNFTANDVYGIMELCGYESVIRGNSLFCDLDLFSPDDRPGWEYTADIMYHYNVGYDNRISSVVGLPWFNASANLLLEDATDE
ncbi:hypothetical protein AAE478_002704 [Parahypoxylon ruwenzoriense]